MPNKDANMPYLVTVGMTTFNGEQYLEQALQSIMNQTYRNLEIIISDDCSTDAVPRILADYQKKDSRIHVLVNSFNRGIVANFNIPLEIARGKYFFWASQDDLWEPEFVEKTVTELAHSSGAGMCFFDFDNIDESGHRTRSYPPLDFFNIDNAFDRVKQFLMAEEYMGKPNLMHAMLRTEDARRAGPIGRFGNGLWFDIVFGLKMVSLTNCIFVPSLLFHKRNHSEATSIKASRRHGLLNIIGSMQDTRCYFAACANTIRSMDQFTETQKAELLKLNTQRCRRQVIQDAKRPLHQFPYLVSTFRRKLRV